MNNTNKATPLHMATLSHSVDNMKLLVKHGAAIESKNNEGNTPMHLAVQESSLEMVRWLD